MRLPKEPMAFPSFVDQYDYGLGKDTPKSVALGMTLRDYFAAKAMCVLMPHWSDEEAAQMAYEMADAMLKAREA